MRHPLPDRERPAHSEGRASQRPAVRKTPRAPPLTVEEIQARVLHRDGLSAPIRYPELARVLGVEVGARLPAQRVQPVAQVVQHGRLLHGTTRVEA